MPFLGNFFQKQSHQNEDENNLKNGATNGPSDQQMSPHNESKQKRPRVVIEAPVINDEKSDVDEHYILIKAIPQQFGNECRFICNRKILNGYSWFFSSEADTDQSPLAKKIFALDPSIDEIVFHNSIITVTCQLSAGWDWQGIAVSIGAAIREHLQSDLPIISQELIRNIPKEDVIREKIQEVIDQEINPGIAAHSGFISLVQIENNTISINMGGGCQGCSSAAMTLKGGIESRFRQAVPELGAIYDATDHTAGENPFFS